MKREIFDKYATAIADRFHLTLDEMFSKTKKREIVDARQMLYFLSRERPIRISYIQKFMEDNGHIVTHSTIIHGYNKAKESVDNDQDYADVINQIKNV
tara:strand:+ start:460 stop:753 length:294 start_codon:yes stop_codon:yes gene_type:complete